MLLVSNDAGFCAAMRREFDSSALRVRAAAVRASRRRGAFSKKTLRESFFSRKTQSSAMA